MANVQTEHGYIKIANDLFDALIHTRLPGEARRVFDYIMRMTYGYNRKTFKTTQHKIAKDLKTTQPRVSESLQMLKKREMIINTKNRIDLGRDCLTILGIQKDFEKWTNDTKKRINTEKRIDNDTEKRIDILLKTKDKEQIILNDTEKRVDTKSKKPPKFTPPSGSKLNANGHGWVDAKAWDDFVQHRIEIKKPLSELSVKKNLELLSNFKSRQKEIIDLTIRSRWQGLFPPKNNQAAVDECDGPRSKILRAPDGN